MHLILTPSTKANHVKYFPTSGYLGLSPVKVEGVVQTRLDPDMKLLPSKLLKVSVRCYEARMGALGGVTSSNVLVDHSRTLWESDAKSEYTPLGNGEYPFSITIPKDEVGFSTTSYVEYKVFWRVEATLLHTPMNGIGARLHKHSDLLLLRYDTPPLLPPVLPIVDVANSKAGAPLFRYSLQPTTSPVGPTDVLAVPITVMLGDSNIAIRSVSMQVERRIQLFNPASQSGTSPIPMTPLSPKFNSSAPSSINSVISSMAVPDSAYSSTALLIPPQEGSSLSRTVKATVADAQSTTPFTKQADGSSAKTLILPWPNARTNSRWSIGETLTMSELISVRFYAHVKISLSSSAGSETIELPERELLIVATNESERSVALNKYNAASSRSKSKSPGRQRRESKALDGLTPLPSSKRSSALLTGSPTSDGRSKKSSSRRPHTSAGPRDRTQNSRNHVVGDSTPDTLISRRRNAPVYRISTVQPISKSGDADSCTSSSDTHEDTAEWEQMLLFIERQSTSKSHNMHGFKAHNGRSRGATVAVDSRTS